MTQSSEKIQHSGIQSRLYVGQWVRIETKRPHKEQWHGAVGQIAAITNKDIIYVATGRHTPCFYSFEIIPIEKQEDAA